MPESWDVYLTQINDKVASVFLDLGVRPTAPDAARPYLIRIWVDLKSPRDDGLPTSEESFVLDKSKEAIDSSLKSKYDVRYVGRVSTAGRRGFFF